jgi:hypothetical protein
LVDFLSEVIGFSPSEANEIASSLTADWHPPNTSGSKTGIVLIDVGWHRRISEKHGFPPSEEPEVIAHWEVEDDKNPRRLSDSQGFEDVEAALAWARERAPLVLVRLGPTDDDCYSAGERLATRELGEFGGTDLTPYPEWPPAERV